VVVAAGVVASAVETITANAAGNIDLPGASWYSLRVYRLHNPSRDRFVMTGLHSRLARLILLAALCLATPATRALDPGLPPGGNFDLSHWKEQLPTDGGLLTCTNLGTDSFTPAQLEAGTNNIYFYTGTDGAMVFWAPVNGATTSGSDNPRSELRERIDPTSDSLNWFAWGTHILDAECKVLQVSTAPGSEKKVIFGQIHGYSGAALPTVKLQYNNGTLEGFIKTNAVDTKLEKKFIFGSVALSNSITYQIKVVNGLVSIAMNNVTNSLNIFVADPQWRNETMYFKAGNYNQDPSCSNPSNYGARVAFYDVTLFHAPSITNQPASQTVTVGSNVTFAVSAAGNPPLRYFWRFNTNLISGATNPTFTIPNVQLTNAGSYSVIITDCVGTVTSVVTSSVATLTVLSFGITAIAREGDNIRIAWAMGAGKTNALQRAGGAADGSYSNNFADFFTVTNTVGTTTNYLDVGAATNTPALYYRVRLVP
jgi:hypothetical protein